MIGVFIALSVPFFRDIRISATGLKFKPRLLFLLFGFGGSGLIILFLESIGVHLKTVSRFLALMQPDGGTSGGSRIWLFENALRLWAETPFLGHGLGSFALQMGWVDNRAYPHNIILEILVEMGVVGLCLWGLVVFLVIKNITHSRLRNSSLFSLGVMYLVFTGVNTMVSGDLVDNRFFFAILGLIGGMASTSQCAD